MESSTILTDVETGGDDLDGELLLAEQACFALYSASRAITDVYRPLLAELDLTYPQYLVLLVLWESEPRTVKQVAEALDLDYGTVSPLLKRLEARGLVARRRSTADERTVVVVLTDEGRAMRAQVRHVPAAIGCAMGLDREGRADLIARLRAVTATAQAALESRPGAGTAGAPAGDG